MCEAEARIEAAEGRVSGVYYLLAVTGVIRCSPLLNIMDIMQV